MFTLVGMSTVEFEHCNRLLLSTYIIEDSSQCNLSEAMVLSQYGVSPPPAKKVKQDVVEEKTTTVCWYSMYRVVVQQIIVLKSIFSWRHIIKKLLKAFLIILL